MTPRALCRRFFLMETGAASGPDSILSQQLKRQTEQRCANHLRDGISRRSRRAPLRAWPYSPLQPTAAAARHAPSDTVPARLTIHRRRCGAVATASTRRSRCKSTPSGAVCSSWRRVRLFDPSASPARSQSGNLSSAAPTTVQVLLLIARADAIITASHAANAHAVHRPAALARGAAPRQPIRRSPRRQPFNAAPNALPGARRVLLQARAGELQPPNTCIGCAASTGTIAARLSKRMRQSGAASCPTAPQSG